jgi:uncharacterized protein (DUF433 family)
MPVSNFVREFAAGREMDKLLKAKFRRNIDPREQPLYTVKEAAYYLGVEPKTLSTWFFGRPYSTKYQGEKFWHRVIVPADPDLRLLSFFNLVEAHILAATRYEHKVPFWAVRDAIANVAQATPEASHHPLLSDEFFTNGRLLFVKQIEEYTNVSSQQLSLEIMQSFLVRVVRDDELRSPFKDKKPYKIFPLRPGDPRDNVISIMAGVSSSRPIIDGTRIPAMSVWRRFKAGEDENFIAQDYDIEPAKIRRAIEYIERRAA